MYEGLLWLAHLLLLSALCEDGNLSLTAYALLGMIDLIAMGVLTYRQKRNEKNEME